MAMVKSAHCSSRGAIHNFNSWVAEDMTVERSPQRSIWHVVPMGVPR